MVEGEVVGAAPSAAATTDAASTTVDAEESSGSSGAPLEASLGSLSLAPADAPAQTPPELT